MNNKSKRNKNKPYVNNNVVEQKTEIKKPNISYYYNFEIETDDSFSEQKDKKILSYTTIKAKNAKDAEAEVRNIYYQRNLNIYQIKLLGVEQL